MKYREFVTSNTWILKDELIFDELKGFNFYHCVLFNSQSICTNR
ncbi:hypothetical protein [Enterococcus cecorum]|nr:hypothetical protein [Enterococcus cecorum]